MSVLNKKLEDLSFDDIEKLVSNEKPGENVTLDYKSELPRDIHKLISALANTYGGWIFIGIETEKDTNKPKKIKNVTQGNLEDTIDSICIDNIYPPVFCKSRYIENENGDKRVFVIRVEESDMTPHAVKNNSTVYIKTLAQKRPILDRADLDKIKWLENRRARFVNLRETIIERAFARYKKINPYNLKNGQLIKYYVIPKYPKSKLRNEFRLSNFLTELQSRLPSVFERYDKELLKTINSGIICPNHAQCGRLHHLEINCYGMYFNIALLNTEDDGENNYINLLTLANIIWENLYITYRFIKDLQIENTMKLFIEVNLPDNISIGTLNTDQSIRPSRFLSTEFDNNYSFSNEFSPSNFQKVLLDIFDEIIDGFVVAFGGAIEYKPGVVARNLAQYMKIDTYYNREAIDEFLSCQKKSESY